MPPQLLAVGRARRPHGVRGHILLDVLTDFPDQLAEVKTVYLGPAAEPHPLVEARLHGKQLLIRLGDCADREAVERFRGQLVQIEGVAAKILPPGHYYHHQIIGLQAITEEGEVLGRITEVLVTGANDVYVIAQPAGGELLIPALKSVMKNVDLEQQVMTVHLLDGLREINAKPVKSEPASVKP